MALISSTPVANILPAQNKPEPAPFYYLDNFRSLVSSVYALYDDLLTPAENRFYQHFMAMESNAQALLVRLLGRNGELFRVNKLKYPEIGDIPLAIAMLVSDDFACEPLSASVDELFPLFTKAEWLQLLNKQTLKQANKDSLKIHLSENDYLLPNILSASGDKLIKLNCKPIFSTYTLLFFGNGRQDLTDFITEDLGIFRFEKYRIHKQSRFFETRAQVDSMLQYYALQEALLDLKPYHSDQLISLLDSLPPLQAAAGTNYAETVLQRRLQRAYLAVARQLERLGSLDSALSIYQHCDQPPSKERQARILHKQKKTSQAREICEGLLNAGSEAEMLFAKRFLTKLNTTAKPPLEHTPYSPPTEVIELAQSEQCVELALAEYYAQQGKCFYLENQLFLKVFGMVFWPAIFADVQGAFTHQFQSHPHDLSDQHFATRRQQQIAQGWARLEQWLSKPEQAVEFFHQKNGISNPFVTWQRASEEALLLALQRIPLSHFKAVFQRLWCNLKENRSGFPDLVLFPSQGSYELIEVKAPGDRVQNNQARWFAYFAEHNIPHRVSHVTWR